MMQSIAPSVSLLVTAGIAIFVFTLFSFAAAHFLGGSSRAKRKAVFSVCSFIGFLGILYFVYLRMSGKT